MVSRRRFSAPLLAWLLVLVAFAPPAWAAESFTVLLKDGTRYEQVTYRLRSDFNVLEIQNGYGVANVSFSDIQAIYDADGNDVAPSVLGKGYRPVTAAPDSTAAESDSVEARERAGGEPEAAVTVPPTPEKTAGMERRRRLPQDLDRWSVTFALDGRMDLPFGDYYTGTDGGIGFGGTMHLRLSRDLALRASITRLGIDFGSEFGLVSYDPFVQIVSQDYQLDGVRYLAGLEYYKALGRGGEGWGFWYVHSSLGAIRHGLKGEAVIYDQVANQTLRAVVDDSDTRFTQQQGVGVIYGISERIGLLGAADLDFVWTEVRDFDGDISAGIKGLVFGASFGFAVRL